MHARIVFIHKTSDEFISHGMDVFTCGFGLLIHEFADVGLVTAQDCPDEQERDKADRCPRLTPVRNFNLQSGQAPAVRGYRLFGTFMCSQVRPLLSEDNACSDLINQPLSEATACSELVG